MNQSLIDFFRAVQEEHKMYPWQKEILNRLTTGSSLKPILYKSVSSEKEERWGVTLAALRACWEMGEATVMFSPEFCSLSRPEVIFDDFLFIDDDLTN